MIWFDLDNSPHVPLFRPIFARLDQWDIPYYVTAREFAQTRNLLDFWKVKHTLVGTHAGKNKIRKILNLVQRSSQLKSTVAGLGIQLAVSHGSRSQVVAAKRMSIPSIVMLDYEYTENRIFNTLATYILVPVYIPDSRLATAGFNLRKVIRYKGFKEELYLQDFVPDPRFFDEIGLREDQILVTIRPPGMVGNYHDSRSEELLLCALNHFSSNPNVICLIVNRTKREKQFVTSHLGNRRDTIRFLEKPVDGLQLLYHSDIALSGGGTMNREAALLGTETYSFFTGRRPYLDEYLEQQGMMHFVNSTKDIENIVATKKTRGPRSFRSNADLVDSVTTIIKEKATQS